MRSSSHAPFRPPAPMPARSSRRAPATRLRGRTSSSSGGAGAVGAPSCAVRPARYCLRARRAACSRKPTSSTTRSRWPLPLTRTPWVTTLHDLQHRELPQLFSRARRAYRSVAYDGAARRADAVVVPTAYARERAVELLGLAPGKVHAIAHGVDHALFRPAHEAREPFLLYPAHAWPHKNHSRLFAALGLAARRASRSSGSSSRAAANLLGSGPARGSVARPRARRRARGALRAGLLPGLPEPV